MPLARLPIEIGQPVTYNTVLAAGRTEQGWVYYKYDTRGVHSVQSNGLLVFECYRRSKCPMGGVNVHVSLGLERLNNRAKGNL